MQVCGTAHTVVTTRRPPGGLHGASILPSGPHARILHIDTAAAAAMPGVRGIYTGGWSQNVAWQGRVWLLHIDTAAAAAMPGVHSGVAGGWVGGWSQRIGLAGRAA